jgi:CRP-like cAMP-binding protein
MQTSVTQEDIHYLANGPIMKYFPQEMMANLLPFLQVKILKAGEILLQEGTVDGNIYVILSGLIKGYYILMDRSLLQLFTVRMKLFQTLPPSTMKAMPG